MFKKKQQTVGPVETSVVEGVTASKQGKKRTLRVSVFPKEGGRPYFADVEPTDKGMFTLVQDDPMTYKIQRGSVWEEDGKLRAVVNEGNPLTVNAYTLVGDDSFDPVALNGVASNNLWEQYAEIARRKNAWKQASTWSFITLGVVFILVMIWNVRTTGAGFEELKDAIANLQLGSGGGDGGASTGSTPPPSGDAAGSGHQPIAPGGGGP